MFYGYNALRERAAERILNDTKYLFIASELTQTLGDTELYLSISC